MSFENLHLLPDDKFVERFLYNLSQIDSKAANRFIIKSDTGKFKFLKGNYAFGKPGSKEFLNFAGNLENYKNIYIHFFNEYLYRSIAEHTIKNVNWLIWGGDLYQRNDFKINIYEPHTKIFQNQVGKTSFKDKVDIRNIYRNLKKRVYVSAYEQKAFEKVSGVLTWMEPEFEYARMTIPSLSAKHIDFHYDVEFDQKLLLKINTSERIYRSGKIIALVGNSATATNNHIDAFDLIKYQINNDFRYIVPMSYGDTLYKEYVRDYLNLNKFDYSFIENYLSIVEYLELINACDIMLFNHLRPQGVGNILMAMLLNKPIFLNQKSVLYVLYKSKGYDVYSLDQLEDVHQIVKNFDPNNNFKLAKEFLSHENLLSQYSSIFLSK